LVIVATIHGQLALAAPPKVQPQKGQSQEGLFSRQLVEKVKKGAIYIWVFGAEAQGGPLSTESIGSGFIFHALPEENAAYALTNHHVAGNSAMLKIELWDNSTYKAQLVATEPGIDTALIKIFDIPRDAYEPNILGDSDILLPGDLGLALGAPGAFEARNTNRSDPWSTFGLHQTSTMRVIKGLERDPFTHLRFWSSFRLDLGQSVMTNLPYRIVTQAAINGGNSGGPLYNMNGEVIGLNHAGSNPGSVVLQDANYTIPINVAKKFAYDIINTGKHEIPWLGLDMLFPPEWLPMSDAYGVMNAVGVWMEKHADPETMKVYGVRHDSPAERAGFKRDDVIVDFDGRQFKDILELRPYIFELPLGRKVPVTVRRGHDKLTLEIEVGVKRIYDSEYSY
jgi:S1-C subfamily serine protease